LEEAGSQGFNGITTALQILRESRALHPEESIFGTDSEPEWNTLRRFFQGTSANEEEGTLIDIAKAVSAEDHKREALGSSSEPRAHDSSDEGEEDLLDQFTRGLSLGEDGETVLGEGWEEGGLGVPDDAFLKEAESFLLGEAEAEEEVVVCGTCDEDDMELDERDQGNAAIGEVEEWEVPWSEAVVIDEDPEASTHSTPRPKS